MVIATITTDCREESYPDYRRSHHLLPFTYGCTLIAAPTVTSNVDHQRHPEQSILSGFPKRALHGLATGQNYGKLKIRKNHKISPDRLVCVFTSGIRYRSHLLRSK